MAASTVYEMEKQLRGAFVNLSQREQEWKATRKEMSVEYIAALSQKYKLTNDVNMEGDPLSDELPSLQADLKEIFYTNIERERSVLLERLEKLRDICVEINKQKQKIDESVRMMARDPAACYRTQTRPSFFEMQEMYEDFCNSAWNEYCCLNLLLMSDWNKMADDSFTENWEKITSSKRDGILAKLQEYLEGEMKEENLPS
ncbi:uncharacterized protein LOC111631328 isoform X2 [Centruroides sculpturatus]|uniref:uncharacterized protein LOC111631328 isoform X2 n=1 Tax=Centruroides sculpturatus TaxID=218467 RepID=UPI000C6D9F02|nr:uncharacterized protein LOC111631328 isoform X2 [Centruroides sculpturatus]